MKLGILECGRMPKRLQTEFVGYAAMLIEAFDSINAQLTFTTYKVLDDHLPNSALDCDAYITTGSFHGVNDDLFWIPKLIALIKECQQHNKKFVGICFGHQLLAKALGGEVRKSELGPGVGLINNQRLSSAAWMVPNRAAFNMIISHDDQVTTMPAGATLLASNAHCKNFMFQYAELFLGIQGHPEFDGNFSRALLTLRAKDMPKETVQAGYDSLVTAPDNDVLMRWITNFLGCT